MQKHGPPSFRPWAECHICGEDWPQENMSKHRRLEALVCPECDDELGYEEIFAKTRLPTEDRRSSEQPVSQQGGTHITHPYLTWLLTQNPVFLADYYTSPGIDLVAGATLEGFNSPSFGAEDPTRKNSAVRFSSSYIVSPANTTLDPKTGSMSWETWTRWDGTSILDTYAGILHKSQTSAGDGIALYFHYNSSGYYTINANIENQNAGSVIAKPPVGWNHVAATMTCGSPNSTTRVYYNSELLVSAAFASDNLINSNRLVLGGMNQAAGIIRASSNDPNNFCSGLFGTTIYDRVLTPIELSERVSRLRDFPA